MSTLYVDTINEKTSGNGVQIPGHVIQVVKTTNQTQTVLSSATSYADITGMSLSITPKQTSSHFIVTWSWQNVYFVGNGSGFSYRLVKDGTALWTPSVNYSNYSTGGQHWSVGYSYYDASTHTTLSPITFKLQAIMYLSSPVVEFNDASAFLDTMIIQEIAQ